MLLTPAQIKPQSFELRWHSFFTLGGCVSCLRACLGAMLLPQSYQYPNLSEGADRVSGQLCRDKYCPFSGVTKSGRVWRKVPESDAWSVGLIPVYCFADRAVRRVIPPEQCVFLADDWGDSVQLLLHLCLGHPHGLGATGQGGRGEQILARGSGLRFQGGSEHVHIPMMMMTMMRWWWW